MIKTYIINLKHDTERWDKIEKLLKGSKLDVIRYEGIYGKEMSQEDIVQNTNILCRNLLCSKGIIGCAMSHSSLWKKLLNEKDDIFLIMEDDLIDINFEQLYKLIDNLDTFEWDLINLHTLNLNNKKVIKQIEDIEIVTSFAPCTFAGYIVNKKGLEKLVNIMNKQKIIWHIDTQISLMKTLGKIKYYNTGINIVFPTQNTSTINSVDNTPIKKILKILGLDKFVWYLSMTLLSIKLEYNITIYHIVLLLLFIINLKTIKSKILYIIIIVEFIFLSL